MLDSYLTDDATKDQLIAARMATLRHEAKSSDAIAFRDDVLPLLYQFKAEAAKAKGERTRQPQPKVRLTHEQTLDAILADLVFASGNVEALGYCFRSSNRQEFTASGIKASSRVYDWQVAALEATGLMGRAVGLSGFDDFDGQAYVAYRRATRIRATPVLLAIAQRHGITAESLYDHYVMPKGKKVATPLVLRGGKHGDQRGRILTCPDTDKAEQLRQQIERINAIYARHRFEGMPEPEVYRLFNCADSEGFDFDKGGRLYGSFQDIRRESRRSILIDGQPVVELDLKASQLTILYAITKTPMADGDPYQIDGLPRAVVKALVTAMIGLGHTNLSRWPSEARNKLLIELGEGQPMDTKTFGRRYPVRKIAAQVLKRHPVLYHLSPAKLDWADLQFIESNILISAILQLGEECGIPALPIHDSIIVPKKDEAIGHMCLSGTFQRTVKRKPAIEAKE